MSNSSSRASWATMRSAIGFTAGSPIQLARILGVNVAVENFSNFCPANVDCSVLANRITKSEFQSQIGVGTVIAVEGAIYVPDTRTLEPNLADPADAILKIEG